MKLLLLAALVALTAGPGAPAPVRLTVRPALAAAPATLHALVILERDARNRALGITVDGESYFQSGDKPIDGDQAQRVWDFWWHDLPCGRYVVSAEVLRAKTEAQLAPARERAQLLGADCSGGEL